MPSTSAPRAPSSEVVVASGTGGSPASRRAAATSSAVRRAVPEGASALSGWCSSTTSTDSKYGAASRRTASSAPRRPRSWGRSARPRPGRRRASRAGCRAARRRSPVVPTTAWMPWSTQKRRLSITASGWVKSTTASAPAAKAPRCRHRRRSRRRARGRRWRPRPAHLGADLAPGAQDSDLACARPYRAACGLAGWSHGGAADPGQDPVGSGLHGRPARRPRPRDRLWSGCRRRADLQPAADRQALRDRPLRVGCGPHPPSLCAVHRGRPVHGAPDRPGHACGCR